MKIVIDTDDIQIQKTEAGEFVFNPGAEESILQLLQLQKDVEAAVNEVRHKIAEDGLAEDSLFRGVSSDKVVASYSFAGGVSKYYLEEDKLENVPQEFFEAKTKYKVDTKKVEAFAKANGGLPYGIKATERTKSLKLYPKKGSKQ